MRFALRAWQPQKPLLTSAATGRKHTPAPPDSSNDKLRLHTPFATSAPCPHQAKFRKTRHDRALKEFFTNAPKCSGAKETWLRMDVRISFEDNSLGFDP